MENREGPEEPGRLTKVIYSTGARLAGGGIGTIAYHEARGLHRHGLLHQLLCGSARSTEIPKDRIRALGIASRILRKLATYEPGGRLWFLESIWYDWWANRQFDRGELFQVWGNYGLRSLRRAGERGMTSVLVWASSHPLYQKRLLNEEYSNWGLVYRHSKAALRRAITELETADYILIPSDFVRASFRSMDFPDSRILQVPFGADLDRFRPATRPESEVFRVLFMGQIGLRKGVPHLLQAWELLAWSNAELWLVGRLEPSFRSIFRRWERLSGIRLVGYVNDPIALLQQADVFAFPTIEEGSALVIYEALACGLPVVTTPNAGSVVQDGDQGYLVPIRDVHALADRLERLRANPRRRIKMGSAARERANSYSWDTHGDLLSETLLHVMRRGKSAR